LGRGELVASGLFEDVHAFFGVVEFGRGGVQADPDVLTGAVAGLFDGLDHGLDGGLVAGQVGGETAFVTDVGAHALGLQHFFQGMEDFRAHAQRFLEGGGLDGQHHKLLDVNRVVRVGTAVEDVHHRDGQGAGIDAAEVAVEGLVFTGGSGACCGEGDAEDGISAEFALVRCAIEVEHDLVEDGLLADVKADQLGADHFIDIVDGSEDALAAITFGIFVAELVGLVHACGGAGGHSRAACMAVFGKDFDFDGGIAA